jgi:prephenate dehydratase
MSKIIIGYQGTEGSNNNAAALAFVERMNWTDVELRPMVSGKNVMNALQDKTIDYGVFAYSTDARGLVAENVEATKDIQLQFVDLFNIDLHHHLWKKNSEISNDSITAIASHPEALYECKDTVKKLYPNADNIPVANTAVAASELAAGKLPETTAVLCSEKAAKISNLALVKDCVEDLEHNGTKFALVKLPQ